MNFEWDEAKRANNLLKHGLDFVNAHQVFGLPTFVVPDDREDYIENRYQVIGLLNGNFVVVVFTEPDDTAIRIISLRKATLMERKIYEREV